MMVWNSYFSITMICMIAVAMIISYGLMKCYIPGYVDPLTVKLSSTPYDLLRDGWAISHLLLFTVIGYLYPEPQYLLFAWVLGVLWELTEYGVKDTSIFPSACVHNMVSQNSGRWWYGRWQDVVMNSVGLVVGVICKNLFKEIANRV